MSRLILVGATVGVCMFVGWSMLRIARLLDELVPPPGLIVAGPCPSCLGDDTLTDPEGVALCVSCRASFEALQ